MTAIVALETGQLSDVVKTSKRAFAKEGSSLYLRRGEEMSLHHLLYGLMLRSGNDAAVAIAEHVGGSEEGFVYMMNEKAEMLGLKRRNSATRMGWMPTGTIRRPTILPGSPRTRFTIRPFRR